MATTTNFGWETPDDTDLVKDGAAAMRTLGNSIDTSFVDLKGGTSGQILSKASNTDLDYTWVTNDVGDITAVTAGTGITGGGTSGAVTITNSMATAIDAKGDLVAGTGADAFARIAVGGNTAPLVADSAETTGLRWDNDAWTTYTPVWTAGTTNPVLGNGTIVGRYKQRGKTIDVRILLTLGSTTTVGSGVYFLSLPVNASDGNVGGMISHGWVVDASTGAYYHIFSDTADGVSKITMRSIVTNSTFGTLDNVTATTPITFTNLDVINIAFSYEVA
jgi:hypothetical protein